MAVLRSHLSHSSIVQDKAYLEEQGVQLGGSEVDDAGAGSGTGRRGRPAAVVETATVDATAAIAARITNKRCGCGVGEWGGLRECNRTPAADTHSLLLLQFCRVTETNSLRKDGRTPRSESL